MKLPWKTILSVLAVSATLCLVQSLRADTFDDANRAFAEGRFADSVRGYETVLKHDGYSPAVLFDLGNAHLRASQPGDAILDYERARWLAPHDADIAANLRLARQRAGLAAADESWIEDAAGFLAPNAWAWLGSTALVALCAGVVGAQLRTRHRTTYHLFTAAGAVVLLGAVGAVTVDAGQLDRAILPAKGTVALLSPFNGAKTVFEFPAGQAVTVEKAHGSFCFVRDAGGHAGWVANAQVDRIASDSISG